MPMYDTMLALIPLLPLVGAVVHGVLATRRSEHGAPVLACALTAASLAISVVLFAGLERITADGPLRATMSWLTVSGLRTGDLVMELGFHADRMALLFAIVVSGVSLAAHGFAVAGRGENPQKDGSVTREFAYLQLVTAAMLVVVLAADLVTMFFGWQAVAVAAFLLVGLRGDDDEAAGAATKTFVMARIGDVGMVLGIAMTAVLIGTVDFSEITRAIYENREIERLGAAITMPIQDALAVPVPELGLTTLTAIAGLFMLAALVRGAQTPFQVWMPATAVAPISARALLHGAAMTLGAVYLLARLSPLLVLTPLVLGVLAFLGALTAMVGGIAAYTAGDARRVVASIAIAHLGLVMLGAGSGSFDAALYHATTASIFVALLTLAVGAAVRTANTADLNSIGAAARSMPAVSLAILVGALGAAAAPIFGGFLSTMSILLEVKTGFNEAWSTLPVFTYLFGLGGVALVACASTRLLICARRNDGGADGAVSANGGNDGLSSSAALSLRILTLASIVVGYIGIPNLLARESVPSLFQGWVRPSLDSMGHYPAAVGEARPGEWSAFALVLILIVVGMIVGRILAARRSTTPRAETFGVDESVERAYLWLVLKPLERLTSASAWFETRVVDGVTLAVARTVRSAGFLISRFQIGDVQFYGIVMLLGFAGIVLFHILSRI